jgi:exosortase
MISATASTPRDLPMIDRARALVAGLPWVDWLLLVLAGVFAFGPVSITWSTNPNYGFGWWIPFVAAFLFYERWPTRPPRAPARNNSHWMRWLVGAGLIYAVFRLAAEADPDWRPGLWIMVGLYVTGLYFWLYFHGGRPWLRHFAFPVGFVLLGLPWLYEVEHPLTQELMQMNAIFVAFTLQCVGIAAEALGNIIQLSNCQLGVEEACSGILSLQASLVMGLLLGEIYRLSVRRRLALVAICLCGALVGNYLRTLFLALVASFSGPAAVTQWHDTAGFSILILTALIGWIACLLLHHDAVAAPPAPAATSDRTTSLSIAAPRFAIAVLVVAIAAEALTQGWFSWRETRLEKHPFWTLQAPAAGQPMNLPPLTLAVLMCDGSSGFSWRDAQGRSWTGMWFEYKPKPSNRVVLGWHTPDKCLPSVGWVKAEDYDEFRVPVNGINLGVRPMKFMNGSVPIYVFWVVYPNRGYLPLKMQNPEHEPLSSKLATHLRDVWEGNRGVGVETLEMAVLGVPSYDEAKAAYLEQLQALVRPADKLVKTP